MQTRRAARLAHTNKHALAGFVCVKEETIDYLMFIVYSLYERCACPNIQ